MTPTFYLGAHSRAWLWSGEADFPLFVSDHIMARSRVLHRAVVRWALDSGAYSQLSRHGAWQVTPRAYVQHVASYVAEVGSMDWAAPMDWMCEPHVVAKTGLSVTEHQYRTVMNLTELEALWPEYSDAPCPLIPVLQAAPGDADGYLRCAAMYEDAGVDLASYPTVGVGSVCRAQSTSLIWRVAEELHPLGLPLHWFGVKSSGLPAVWHPGTFASFDSMAWSYAARREPPLPGCTYHQHCSDCIIWARRWRQQVLNRMGTLAAKTSA